MLWAPRLTECLSSQYLELDIHIEVPVEVKLFLALNISDTGVIIINHTVSFRDILVIFDCQRKVHWPICQPKSMLK